MMQAQIHRGPDDEGQITIALPDGFLALGHRRLSILDLTTAGRQPMENPATGDLIVFNGEIYNYPALRVELEAAGVRFRSRCDTEAILHAFARWGTGAFDRLHGMFALGLFHKREQRLILARDALGIKPLYYTWGRNGFVFASEMRAISASGLAESGVDRRALASLFAYGAVPEPLTLLRNIHVLSAGTWAVIDLTSADWQQQRMRHTRYWEFPSPRQPLQRPQEIRNHVATLLEEAVRSHLISDVPVGVLLSSGIDSTGVTALASASRRGDIDAFTISAADDDAGDENPIAQRTARSLGIRHHPVKLMDAEMLLLAEKWLACLDQPSVDGLNTYIIARAVRDRSIVVALSGLGGDELFGGYQAFHEVPRLARWGGWVPRFLRRGLAYCLSRHMSKVRHRKAMQMAGGRMRVADLYFRRRRLLSDLELHALGFEQAELNLNDDFLPPESEPNRVILKEDAVATISVLESRFYMGNMLLRDSDVFSMAHSLELRVPLLDRRLIDYVYSLPGNIRLPPGSKINKPLLVEALANKIPPELARLRKRGFCLPQARWLAGPLRPLFESLLQVVRESGLVNPEAVTAVWENFLQDPAGPTWSRVWMIGVAGAWLKRNLSSAT